jgi:hypothetical protein
MSSIYARVLGADFARLHPLVRRRFGVCEEGERVSVGVGVMDEIWHGGPHLVPFLRLGARRKLMFPERGRSVPFRIENYAYRDGLGRACVSWHRTFALPGRHREFTATMVYAPERGCIVDYLGDRQHLAVDLHLGVSARGGMRIRSGAQRFYEGALAFPFPLALSGVADVEEWYDDEAERFRIEVRVTNPLVGPVFGYRGSFVASWPRLRRAPARVLPRRIEARV